MIAAVALAAACGGDDRQERTGRVLSIDNGQLCITDDRGETSTCVDVPDSRAMAGVDVGECVVTSVDLADTDSRVEVLPESGCIDADSPDG